MNGGIVYRTRRARRVTNTRGRITSYRTISPIPCKRRSAFAIVNVYVLGVILFPLSRGHESPSYSKRYDFDFPCSTLGRFPGTCRSGSVRLVRVEQRQNRLGDFSYFLSPPPRVLTPGRRYDLCGLRRLLNRETLCTRGIKPASTSENNQ